MDLDALREAVEWYDEDAGQVLPGSTPHERIVAAARAVLDSEEVWWCETHRVTGREAFQCTYSELMTHLERGPFKPCSMVRVRLLAEEKL